MKNKLVDLNNHLFAQLERLSDEDISADDLAKEVQRTDAMVAVSDQIVRNADMVLKAARLVAKYGAPLEKMLPMIEAKPPAEAKPAIEGNKK